MSGPINCPLCGETVLRLGQHVETAHSSKYCAKCQICSLKSDPPEETKCMECGDIIGGVKEEPPDLVLPPVDPPTLLPGSGAVRVRMIPISSLVSVLPTSTSSLLSPPQSTISVQSNVTSAAPYQKPFVRANNPVKQPIQCNICGQWFNNKDSNLSKCFFSLH